MIHTDVKVPYFHRKYFFDLTNSNSTAEWASNDTCKRDLLKTRVNIIQYPANLPWEDRFDAVQLSKSSGYYSAVFDGHGGWQVSNYAMKYLPVYLDNYLKDANTSEEIHNAIYKAFDQVESEWYQKLKSAFDIGFGKASTVGSCALIVVVKGNKMYVANAGDWEAVLVRKEDDGSLTPVRICRPFSWNDPEEQKRLKSEFPKDSDIVMCRSQDLWYVKGALMPTRSIGDFRLKHPEMNYHNHDQVQGFRPPIREFNGPYITHKPEIREIDLTAKDAFVVLASDGLWDEVKFDEVGKILKDNYSSGVEISQCLLNTVLNRAAERHGKSRDFILNKNYLNI